MKRVGYRKDAMKGLARLPRPVQDALVAKIDRYAATGAGDVRTLSNRPGARLRHRDYRAILIETEEAIDVVAIGHRKDIY